MINKQITGNPLQTISIKATEDIKPYRFISAVGGYCSPTEIPIGTSERKWKSGDMASIISYGIVLLECQDTIASGDKLEVGSDNGKASKHTSGQFAATALSHGDAGAIIKAKLVI